MLSAVLAAAALMGTAPSACPASLVRYQPAKHPTLGEMPWVLGRPGTAGVAGFLVTYPEALRDGRVNRRDGLVLWQTGATVVWKVFGTSSAPTVVARRVDGRASFRVALTATDEGFVSTPRFPSTGCWQLVVRRGAHEARVVTRVVTAPTNLGCDATQLQSGHAFARPRSSGIRGGWPWQTSGGAQLYTHGHIGGRNMKVLWHLRGDSGSSLTLAGKRLDGPGAFRQEFPEGSRPEATGRPSSTCRPPAVGS